MIEQIQLFLVCIISFELFKFFNFFQKFRNFNLIINNFKKIFSKFDETEEQKEKLYFDNVKFLLKNSLSVLIVLLSIILLLFIRQTMNQKFLDFLFSFIGIIEALIIFLAYSFIRK